MIKYWMHSFRLRTLPLSVCTIGMGSILAWRDGAFDGAVFILALLTAALLQVLSNIANDYGDFAHGADNEERVGPERMVQSGKISAVQMRWAIGLLVLLSLISGLSLLYFSNLSTTSFLIILLLGLSAIIAAVAYTVGKNPYGYRGLGDFFVFAFFGPVGISVTYFLHTGVFSWHVLLPAVAFGLFIAAVLNINNIRDIKTDEVAGKRTIPVLIGYRNAVKYHFLLLLSGWIALIIYAKLSFGEPLHWLFVLSFPLFAYNVYRIITVVPEKLDPALRQLVLSVLFLVFLFALGVYI